MSKFLTDAAVAQFDAMVHQVYQQGGKLRGSLRTRTGVVGSTHRFPVMGKGLATQRIPQTDVIPMNVTHTNATATIEDWNAAEYTDIFDQQKVNFDEKRELATSIANAINRRMDQLIIDALEAASTSFTVAKSVGGTDTNLNVAKLRRASRLLGDNGVPNSDLTYLGSFYGREGLLGETAVGSEDFNTVKALVNGEVNTFLGFSFVWIESRTEGGLTLATNDRTNFAYHKMAAGLAVGIDFRTEVNYIPQKTSWLCNGMFAAGAIAIDNTGIVEITTHEA